MKQNAPPIEKVCVIGAGTMGTGLAAQVANAGLEVLLLDVAGTADAPNKAAERGVERIKKSDPPLLMLPENIERITAGNIRDDLDQAGKCDWIVEAIVERLDIKRALYLDLVPHLKAGALVTSNTSTIPISLLMQDMPDQLRRNFCITHFFNPVRYMRLLELAKGPDTSPQCVERLDEFCDRQLGKGVVHCADTPGFLANRVGVFALQAAIHEASRLGLSVEEADAIFGRPMGMPKTGAFGLYDLIGLDLMADVVRSMRSILPPDDAFHPLGEENSQINRQIELGFTGNKGKGGFYAEIDGEQVSLDLATGKWKKRNRKIPQLAIDAEAQGIELLLEGDDPLSEFAWQVLSKTLNYSASLVPEVTTSPQDIDDAMKLGYNWVQGPFEMMDTIGPERLVKRLESEGQPVPGFLNDSVGDSFYKVDGGLLKVRHWGGKYEPVSLPPGAIRFHMLQRTLEPVDQNRSASLYHLEDGIRLVEFHSKANALDAGSMEMVSKAADDPGEGIIIHNDGAHFSAGVNLN
ncbi:MAG: 3-hydroxyacyl-CoA dehydrogenase NAD-binding domain-containing protein, partial [Rhizobiaceae bacterium]